MICKKRRAKAKRLSAERSYASLMLAHSLPRAEPQLAQLRSACQSLLLLSLIRLYPSPMSGFSFWLATKRRKRNLKLQFDTPVSFV
jgi:hypothetical protein